MLMMRNADLDLCKLAPEHEIWSRSLDPRMIFRFRYSPKVLLPVLDTETPANRHTLQPFFDHFSLHFFLSSPPSPFLRTIMVPSINYRCRALVSINLELLTQHCSESFYRSLAATPHLFLFPFPFFSIISPSGVQS